MVVVYRVIIMAPCLEVLCKTECFLTLPITAGRTKSHYMPRSFQSIMWPYPVPTKTCNEMVRHLGTLRLAPKIYVQDVEHCRPRVWFSASEKETDRRVWELCFVSFFSCIAVRYPNGVAYVMIRSSNTVAFYTIDWIYPVDPGAKFRIIPSKTVSVF